MAINYRDLQDLIVVSPQPLYPVLRVHDSPGLSLPIISSTNSLRRQLQYVVWPGCPAQSRPKVTDHTAQRKVRKHEVSVSGEFYSYKLQRNVQYEAGQEKDFFKLLEESQDLLWYQEQPMKVRYLKNGEDAIYVPDVLICLKPERFVVVEVKPSAYMRDPANVEKVLALRRHCTRLGWGLLITDGRHALSELAAHKLKSGYVSEMRARLRDAPMSESDYKDVAKYYRATEMDFSALILQEEIEYTIRPFQLAAKSRYVRKR